MRKYHWLHIPTGKTGVSEQEFFSHAVFLSTLNSWNASAPGRWQYWSSLS